MPDTYAQISLIRASQALTQRFVFTAHISLIAQFLQQLKDVRKVDLPRTIRFMAIRDLSNLDVTCMTQTQKLL